MDRAADDGGGAYGGSEEGWAEGEEGEAEGEGESKGRKGGGGRNADEGRGVVVLDLQVGGVVV